MRKLLVTAFILVVASGQSRADFLRTYELTTVASGTLGGIPFTNAALDLRSVADTNNIQRGNALGTDYYYVTNNQLTVTVAGIGTATFTDVTRTTTYPFTQAGFEDVGVEFVLLTFNPIFGPYDLRSDIGPASGRSFSSAGRVYPTTLGPLIFSAPVGNSSFQSVPEPSTLILSGCGVIICGTAAYVRSRRQRRRLTVSDMGPAGTM